MVNIIFPLSHSINIVHPSAYAKLTTLYLVLDTLIPTEYQMDPTMLDLKVVSILTNIGCQNFHLCGATPKVMNDLARVKSVQLKEENLKYGLSPLHLMLNSLSHALHVSYNLDLKVGRRVDLTNEQRANLDQRERKVKDALFEALSKYAKILDESW